jgi:hypothetical protein
VAYDAGKNYLGFLLVVRNTLSSSSKCICALTCNVFSQEHYCVAYGINDAEVSREHAIL